MEAMGNAAFITAMDRPVARGRIRRTMLIGLVAAVAGVASVGWVAFNPAQRSVRVAASKITISTVAMAPFHDFIPLRGQVVPLDSVVLDAVQGGRVEAVLAEAGQRVVAGQPLIRLSDPSLELDAIARETQVIGQINSERSQQLSFELTKTSDAKALADANYNIIRLARHIARRQPLVATGFESIEGIEQAADELAYQRRLHDIASDAMQRDAAVIKRSSESIEETAARLQANLVAAKRQLDSLIVRTPVDGLLSGLDAHTGEEKLRGQHLGQIDRDTGFKAQVQVDEFYLARVKVGQHVVATIDGNASELTVSKIYPQVKDRRFEISLAWQGEVPPGLRRGQALDGKLELDADAPAVVLPAGAFLEASGGIWVFVLDGDGSNAIRRSVKLGRRTVETVEVLDGLSPGDRVVTSDYTGFEHIDRLTLSP